MRQQALSPDIDVQAVLTRGRRSLKRRRLRKTGAVVALPVLLIVSVAMVTRAPSTQLVGPGLTLAAGSTGSVQVSGDRVDLGDGVQAWRKGWKIYIGYAGNRPAVLDIGSVEARRGDEGYSIIVPGQGEQAGSLIAIGTVRGAPGSASVTVDGVTGDATIACFVQARGWCAYKAKLPVAMVGGGNLPRVEFG